MRAALVCLLGAVAAMSCGRVSSTGVGERAVVPVPAQDYSGMHGEPRFPMPAQALSGRRVLLILIPMTAPNTAHFITGTAQWTDTALEVRPSGADVPIVARGSSAALEAFDPGVLRELILPEVYPRVAALAAGIEACVAVFVPQSPAVGLRLEEPFFGLASGAAGEVLLMRGDPDLE